MMDGEELPGPLVAQRPLNPCATSRRIGLFDRRQKAPARWSIIIIKNRIINIADYDSR